jgi:hypothetical protein
VPDTPALWNSAARKEAFELLEHLWANGTGAIRDQLSEVLAAGPPKHLGPQDDPTELQRSRDRRMFDRIGLLEREGASPLTPRLQAVMEEIQKREPQWRLAPGDQARFGWWMEVRVGDGGEPHLERLLSFENADEIVGYLLKYQDNDPYGEICDAWRRFATDRPDKALEVLEALTARPDGGPIHLWRSGLWGLRDRAKNDKFQASVLAIVLLVPPGHFENSEFSKAVADLLDSAASGTKVRLNDDFWRVFDLTLAAAKFDPENSETPTDGQWISLAINRSMGTLASALFNGLFAYQLKAGDKIPAQHLVRVDRLIGLGDPAHRPARIIAVSRLPYLFAVDPDWAKSKLIPLLNWDEEPDEALPAWQGFAWHPRVGEELWAQIKAFFLAAFTHERLAEFGASRTTMAELVMLAGIEFDLGTEQARTAIRSMTDEMRDRALWWLWNDLRSAGNSGEDSKRADERWRAQVQPWLAKAWPRDPELRTRPVGQRFALLPCATDEVFPDAVSFVMPFVVAGDANLVLDMLSNGRQADKHPAAVLELLAAALDVNQPWLDVQVLSSLLDRLRRADPTVREHVRYRTIEARVQVARS